MLRVVWKRKRGSRPEGERGRRTQNPSSVLQLRPFLSGVLALTPAREIDGTQLAQKRPIHGGMEHVLKVTAQAGGKDSVEQQSAVHSGTVTFGAHA